MGRGRGKGGPHKKTREGMHMGHNKHRMHVPIYIRGKHIKCLSLVSCFTKLLQGPFPTFLPRNQNRELCFKELLEML